MPIVAAGSPEPSVAAGSVEPWVAAGIEAAIAAVAETSAVILWPIDYCWVGPGTVTSLIEAHGAERSTILRPAWEGRPGWPCLVPLAVARRVHLAPSAGGLPGGSVEGLIERFIQDVGADGVPLADMALGDPGTVNQASVPRDQLPPYLGQEERPGSAEAFDPSEPGEAD